jgi:hypothetical protein
MVITFSILSCDVMSMLQNNGDLSLSLYFLFDCAIVSELSAQFSCLNF